MAQVRQRRRLIFVCIVQLYCIRKNNENMVCCVLLQNVTLLELMDEDDIVQECKSQNRRLVDLLVFYCYFKCAYYGFSGLLLSNTPCLKKTVQNCFCQNFFKFPPILIIFGRKMVKRLKLCEVHSFSTSPNCVTTLPC